MRNFISKSLEYAVSICLRLSRTLSRTPVEKEVHRFLKDNANKTRRLIYDLADESVVFDLGGYEKQWTSDIFAMYCCTVHVFEPVHAFADAIKRRFSRTPKVMVHNMVLTG